MGDKVALEVTEGAAMVMEALSGFEHKFDYKMVGHSGSGPDMPLVEFGQPPANEAERYEVLKKMVSHAGSCSTGDASLDSTRMAVQARVRLSFPVCGGFARAPRAAAGGPAASHVERIGQISKNVGRIQGTSTNRSEFCTNFARTVHEFCTNFARVLREFCANCPRISTNFVRILHESCTNRARILYEFRTN